MNVSAKGAVRSLLPRSLWLLLSRCYEKWFPAIFYARRCYSQDGEDILLELFLPRERSGFYVDVGAYHPIKPSKTFRRYCKGWRGLNIDATPDSMEVFQRIRPRDINVEAAVSSGHLSSN